MLGTWSFIDHRMRLTVDLAAAGALAGALVLYVTYLATSGPSTRGSDNLDVDVSAGGPAVLAIALLAVSALAALGAGMLPRVAGDELDEAPESRRARTDWAPPAS